jgi:hypothetical protein
MTSAADKAAGQKYFFSILSTVSAGIGEETPFRLRTKRFTMSSILTNKFSKIVLIACSAIIFGTNAFSAPVSRGDFTLPVETQWGGALMPPGPYAFELDQAMVGLIISVRGQGKSIRIPAQSTTSGEKFKGSTLVLLTQEGKTSVRSMQFGHLGVTVKFQAAAARQSSFHSPQAEATSRISVRE